MDDVGYIAIGILIVLFSIPLAIAIEPVPITTDFAVLALSGVRISLYTMTIILLGFFVANIPWIRRFLTRITVNRVIGDTGGGD